MARASQHTTRTGSPGAHRPRRSSPRLWLEALEDRLTPSTWFVDPSDPDASDTGPGTADQPLQTIGAGSTRAVAGDTVQVASGTYNETVTVRNSGTASAPILFTAAPGAAAVVTGGTSGFVVSGKSWVTVRGFIITQTTSFGINVSSSSNVTIEGNDVSYAGQPVEGATAYGIRLSGVTDSRVAGNVVHDNTDSGIFLTGGTTRVLVVGNETFRNASVWTRRAPGIDLRSGGNIVAGNVSYQNEDSGIQIRSATGTTAAANNLVVNNVTFDNGDHGIDVLRAPGQRIVGNTVYNNVTSGINIEGGSADAYLANNISVDNGIDSPRTEGNIRVDTESISGTVLDYDLVWIRPTPTTQVMITWGSVKYTSLAAFVAATGMEAHGIEADPLFVAPSAGDLRLRSGSRAIDSADSGANGQPAADRDGRPRVDDPATANTGAGPRPYDDRGAYEFQPTVVTTGSIAGAVYEDHDGDGVRDADDQGLSGRPVFLDANGNGTPDQGEASRLTDASGGYRFDNLPAGTYRVRTVQPGGWLQTTAAPPDVNVTGGGNVPGVDFGSFKTITVSGAVFQDHDADGVRDPEDEGLSDRTVFLDADADGVLDVGETQTTTGADGGFVFTDLGPGFHRVRQVAQAGWAQSTADPPAFDATSGVDVTGLGFGNVFSPTTANIQGAVYEDHDGDGVRDPEERGLAGLTVFLDANNNTVLDPDEAGRTTDADGAYDFVGLAPGRYVVRHLLPAGWVPTTADAHVLDLAGGTTATAEFGDFKLVAVGGVVFEDTNGDRVRNPGEIGYPGVTIYLDLDLDGTQDAGEPAVVTDFAGGFRFDNLGPVSYRVRQVRAAGWTQTTADPGDVAVTSGTDVLDLVFGNFKNFRISGQAFEDLNGNGIREAGEPGLAGRTVFLDVDADGVFDADELSTLTGADGTFALDNVGPGTHHVRQVLPAGWSRTTPPPANISGTSGVDVAGITFGGFKNITIRGRVIQDMDGDGLLETGEGGIANWTVFLDADNDGLLDAGEVSRVTDSAGSYSFTNLGPGTYRVRAVRLSGWTRTTADPAAVIAISGQDAPGLNFGNFRNISITGKLFYDVNRNGVRDGGESWLGGWVVYLDRNNNGILDVGETRTSTSNGGEYKFSNLGPGVYRVRVVLKSGWQQTTANVADLFAMSGKNVTNKRLGFYQG